MVLYARVFGPEGAPLGPLQTIEVLGPKPGAASIVSLPTGEWALAWFRPGRNIVARRLAADGAPLDEVRVLSSEVPLETVVLARLESEDERAAARFIAVWDVEPTPKARRIRARFLDAALVPEERELGFDTMPAGSDWQPAVCATSAGGFALAWTAGEDRSRDTFARVFDRQGKPISRPLGMSGRHHEQDFTSITKLSDGSLLCAWEDDISNWDYPLGRRIPKNGGDPGPTVELCQRVEAFCQMHVAPRVVAVETGAIVVWGDSRRSKGFDVYWRVIGPRFDSIRGGQRTK
jgi:hypothetical protein